MTDSRWPSGPRVLVAGVGNMLLGDDGFGVEVVRRLDRTQPPAGVAVVDYGVRGLHLAYDLCDGYDDVVMVDALGHGGEPGTVSLVDLSDSGTGAGSSAGPTASPAGPTASSASPTASSASPTALSAGPTAVRRPLGQTSFDAHGMQPQAVLELLALLGGELDRVLLVGCEPASLEHRIGLSPAVARAVRPAADLARSVARSLVSKEVRP